MSPVIAFRAVPADDLDHSDTSVRANWRAKGTSAVDPSPILIRLRTANWPFLQSCSSSLSFHSAMRLFRTVLTLGVFAVSALAQDGKEKHAYQVSTGPRFRC